MREVVDELWADTDQGQGQSHLSLPVAAYRNSAGFWDGKTARRL
jgi:hypothetical protein